MPLDEGSIRDYLSTVEHGYPNAVKAVRVFFRRYLKSDAAQAFKVPQPQHVFKKIPTNEEIQKFYRALPDWRSRALFLFYASSGRRRSEILELRLEDVDFERQMLSPLDRESKTKRTWFSFFNEEAHEAYRKYRRQTRPNNGFLFEGTGHANEFFKRTSDKTGIKVSPQVLREWFCSEMGELGVADRYVDAFCGRVPRSVLARHYTDFSPERLKEIYEKAGLRVLDKV